MTDVRRHTRTSQKGKRFTVRRHERDGGRSQPDAVYPEWEPDDSRWGEQQTSSSGGYIIVNDDEDGGRELPDLGPTPYPHDRARAELFVFASEQLGFTPEQAMSMPAVKARIMGAIES